MASLNSQSGTHIIQDFFETFLLFANEKLSKMSFPRFPVIMILFDNVTIFPNYLCLKIRNMIQLSKKHESMLEICRIFIFRTFIFINGMIWHRMNDNMTKEYQVFFFQKKLIIKRANAVICLHKPHLSNE